VTPSNKCAALSAIDRGGVATKAADGATAAGGAELADEAMAAEGAELVDGAEDADWSGACAQITCGKLTTSAKPNEMPGAANRPAFSNRLMS